MKQVSRLTAIFIFGILSISCSASDIKQLTEPDGDTVMLVDNALTEKTWERYLQLFTNLQSESSKESLESYYDAIDQWELDNSDNAGVVVDPLISILYDELGRKKIQLGNKVGKPSATNWWDKLEKHLSRMEDELFVVSFIGELNGDQKSRYPLEVIRQSLGFSKSLVEADLAQIDKRVEAGDYSLDQQQQAIEQRALETLNKANNL